MAGMSGSGADKVGEKKALLISTGKFAGLQFSRGRWSLGWLTVSSVPSAVEDELGQALKRNEALVQELTRASEEQSRQVSLLSQEIDHLKAEQTRAAEENERQRGLLAQEMQALKEQVERVEKESEQRLAAVLQENQTLKEQNSRIVKEREAESAQSRQEIERLQALMERVSAGVR